ncbi:YjgP/YjgQ family permease [Roseiconus nitratireducens]|uniref:YjgP/YjgQ family permease n=1 Tax=Roseiconus nitratireducens TaxID=2605748 RepID=A0A5M6DEU1_9BACT|nr:LptF/LptG family permease [Roseiconus nitratireducens]KAA5543715.1 YjgP/YjgQ family permease [Roseiconus nitratireducens]
MTRIQLRIARDISVIFVVSLFAITTMVMFIGVFRESLNQGLGLVGVVRMLPFALPNALSVAVPGTALFSVCCVYGRMSADNEFTAMQSVGISLMPAVWPAIVITSCLSLATVGLINVAFTWGFNGIQDVVISSVERIAYDVLEREHSFKHDKISMVVRDVQGRKLVEPVINIQRPDGEMITINARTAELRYDPESEGIELSITNGMAKLGDKAAFHFPNTLKQVIPVGTTPDDDLLTAHPSHMPMHDLPKASIRQQQDIRRRECEATVHVAFDLLRSRPEAISNADAQNRQRALSSSRKRLHRLDTEMHRRWASGFTCLAIAMIGIPLAIRMKASDMMATFGTVFLPTVLVYYPVFALTLDMAKDGRLAAHDVWIANLLCIGISVIMMRKLVYQPA